MGEVDLENLAARLTKQVNADLSLVRMGRWVSLEFLWGIGAEDYLVRLKQGRVVEVRQRELATDTGRFSIRAEPKVWLEHWRAVPPRDYHDLFSMLSAGLARMDGDITPVMQNLIYFKGILAAPRTQDEAGS